MDQSNLVPGQLRCAKCGFGLTRNILYAKSGTVGAGTNETEPCPNGCGPLWPQTWEQAARECWKRSEEVMQELVALRAAVNPSQLVAAQRIQAMMVEADRRDQQMHRMVKDHQQFMHHCESIMRRSVKALRAAGHAVVDGVLHHGTACDGCQVLFDTLETLK